MLERRIQNPDMALGRGTRARAGKQRPFGAHGTYDSRPPSLTCAALEEKITIQTRVFVIGATDYEFELQKSFEMRKCVERVLQILYQVFSDEK